MKIALLLRKYEPSKNSIEELFSSIRIGLINKGIDADKVEVKNKGASFLNIFENLNQINVKPFDLVHVTGDVHYMVLAGSKPTVLTVHDVGSAFTGNSIKNFFVKIIWFWLPGLYANRITVISETSKKELIKLIPFAEKKTRVVYNPVNPSIVESKKDFNHECPRILQIGTKENKNLERTIQALEKISCELTIIGKLDDKQISLLRHYKIKYRNHYNLSYSEIMDCYKNCDIVTFASTYEGFGMPIIEAQQTGRPVITSNISSMPEIAGEGACLVDPYDVDAMRRTIIRVINDKPYREELISLGRKNVQRFQVDKIIEEYLKIYKEILD